MAELRVAHVLPVFGARGVNLLGGGERYALNLARNLTEHCAVTLVTFGPRYSMETLDGMEHVTLPSVGGPIDNPLPRTAFTWLRRFDIVHAHQLRTAVTSTLAVACRLIRRPLIVTDLGGGGRSLMYQLRLYRLIPRFLMISRFSLGLLPPSARPRATAVLGGVDLERYPYSEAPRRRQAVLVGRIMPHKGMNYLIDVADADTPVVIAGRIGDQAYYERLRGMSEGRPVTFALNPSDDQVRELYATSAVTVSASVYRDLDGGLWPNSELLGLTLLESMAMGTPVVCTAVGGMPEYVVDGKTGFIVQPNDTAAIKQAIGRILDDPQLARSLGRAGNEHVQQYSWQSLAARVYHEYELLLGRSLPTVWGG
jgi:glycosyltransferase involved in cell wall biosynthesis